MITSARVRLRRTLLRIGGVGAEFIDDPCLQVIAGDGVPFATTELRVTRGKPNECHRNAVLIWLNGKCAAIATGYYLGPDDVWRQHSWGMTNAGTIVDTHSGGRQYFGVPMKSLDAVKFAEDRCAPKSACRFRRWVWDSYSVNADRRRLQPLVEALLSADVTPNK